MRSMQRKLSNKVNSRAAIWYDTVDETHGVSQFCVKANTEI